MPVPFEARHRIGAVLGAGYARHDPFTPRGQREGDAIAQRREDAARSRYTGSLVTLTVWAVILTIATGLFAFVPALLQPFPIYGGLIQLAALLAFLFFGYCLTLLVRVAVRSAVEVRLDASGLLDTSWSDQPIPWDLIAEGRAIGVTGQNVLRLRLHGFDRDVDVSMEGLDRSHDELMAAFRVWRDAYPPSLPNAAS